MVIVTVRGRVKAEHRERFIGHMAEFAPVVRRETGCIRYELNLSAEDPLRTFLYEEWTSLEDLQRHLKAPHLLAHLALARPWFDEVSMSTSEAHPTSL